jgi:WD40 repeat protein
MHHKQQSCHTTLDEYFMAKPVYWDGEARQKFNIRKLIEQPFQQARAGMKEEWEKTMMDYEFMQGKVEAGYLDDLLDDYERMEDQSEEVRLVEGALMLSSHVLRIDKGQLAGQLLGRLLNSKKAFIVKLLKGASHSDKKPWLRPKTAALTEPGGALVGIMTGHTKSVNCVAVTPDGRFVVSASDDHTLKVWDLQSGKEKISLTGHTNIVNGVAVTPDARLAVSASSDNTLKVWDLSSGKEKISLNGHTDWVNGVVVTPDARFAVSASRDKTLKLWDLSSGKERISLIGHTDNVNGVAITPDGRFAVSASDDKILKVWDLKSGKERISLTGHTNYVNGVAITLDGRFAVSASYDKTLKIWDLKSGKEVATFFCDAEVSSCTASNVATTIVAGDLAGKVHFLHLENWRPSETNQKVIHSNKSQPPTSRPNSPWWKRLLFPSPKTKKEIKPINPKQKNLL